MHGSGNLGSVGYSGRSHFVWPAPLSPHTLHAMLALRILSGLVVAGLVTVAAASCSSGPPASRPASAGGPSTASARAGSCPAVGDTSFQWPARVPAGFPVPAGAKLQQTRRLPATEGRKPGTVVSVLVPMGLRPSVVYARQLLGRSGFTIERGDAEQDEADLPFHRAGLAGQFKLREQGPCSTQWIVTIVST